ncbi:PREDICTED: LOW QUALITY PROTEIN: deleted in azoospermia-like [Hipposideros armiger]|uniref:LOW QUALITY PROTEIN: deleted in azoospermia-like n=1 Tax=Hipposideros armiger TaxID=186990 RepID=A0A8B7TAE7_HIPAR|nr:PREDICTED: LOW QUALITY PROTEIN: deleted in azoospermia-like [Hipposideros armiger]
MASSLSRRNTTWHGLRAEGEAAAEAPLWWPLVQALVVVVAAPSCGKLRQARLAPALPPESAANSETSNSTISREASTQSSSAATSQGYVLPEGRIMPNTIFVGGIDVRMDETEIKSFFARYGSVKEVKIITDRSGVSKGYGFVSFYNDVDVQKIVESQINFHGKKLKLGPAIRKHNLCAYHVQPRPLVFNPPPPQFQSVWNSPNTETYMQPATMMNPITQYVQAYPSYPSSPVQVITGYQLPVYNYQMPPQWSTGEQRTYVIPPVYTAVNYHYNEVDSGAEVLSSECSVHEATPSSGNGPQKKSVDRGIQTVVSCLFNPENRMRNSVVTQDEYYKDKRVHHFRRSRSVLKSV